MRYIVLRAFTKGHAYVPTSLHRYRDGEPLVLVTGNVVTSFASRTEAEKAVATTKRFGKRNGHWDKHSYRIVAVTDAESPE